MPGWLIFYRKRRKFAWKPFGSLKVAKTVTTVKKLLSIDQNLPLPIHPVLLNSKHTAQILKLPNDGSFITNDCNLQPLNKMEPILTNFKKINDGK